MADPAPRTLTISSSKRELRLFMIAGEPSGDALGGKLMAALNAEARGRVRYLGVGGEQMAAQGLVSQFPISDIAVMGLSALIPRLPKLMRRVYRTVDAAVAAEPDAIVIIDSAEFTHAVARRVRRKRRDIPIIDYVSPSVWAWRSGRARRMRHYIDHVLALLPFEPKVHEDLGGPPCTYVGHPLIERAGDLEKLDPMLLSDRLGLRPDVQTLVILPGSRVSEVKRLMGPFGRTVALLAERGIMPELVLPLVPHLRDLVEAELVHWPRRPHIVETEDDKLRAFKLARAALAASGTVTLELGLAQTPMVVAYKVDALAARLRFLVKVPSIVLANLVLGRNAFPEFVQEACTPENLADALTQVLADGDERTAQLEALKEIPNQLLLLHGTPSSIAAGIVLKYAEGGRLKP